MDAAPATKAGSAQSATDQVRALAASSPHRRPGASAKPTARAAPPNQLDGVGLLEDFLALAEAEALVAVEVRRAGALDRHQLERGCERVVHRRGEDGGVDLGLGVLLAVLGKGMHQAHALARGGGRRRPGRGRAGRGRRRRGVRGARGRRRPGRRRARARAARRRRSHVERRERVATHHVAERRRHRFGRGDHDRRLGYDGSTRRRLRFRHRRGRHLRGIAAGEQEHLGAERKQERQRTGGDTPKVAAALVPKPKPAASAPVVPKPAVVIPAPETVPSTFSDVVGRDPFTALYVAPAAASGTSTGTGTTGTTAAPGTADPTTTAPSTGTSPTGPAATTSAGKRVSLVHAFTKDGKQYAQTKVDATVFTPAVDDTFATTFKLVSVKSTCASYLNGDESFSLCEGQEVLK